MLLVVMKLQHFKKKVRFGEILTFIKDKLVDIKSSLT